MRSVPFAGRWIFSFAAAAALFLLFRVPLTLQAVSFFNHPASPFSLPSRTDTIQHVKKYRENGWVLHLYRNTAYRCANKGYQTFVLAARENDPLRKPRPLWMFLHGGSVGYFTEDGQLIPAGEEAGLNEEGIALAAPLRGGGLIGDFVKKDSAGFRFLFVSACDYDAYLGRGTADPRNPYQWFGHTRTVDGLLSNIAALSYARKKFTTSRIFVHGISAGSIGAMGLTTALGLQGKHLAGAVLDSAVISPATPVISLCPRRPWHPDWEMQSARLGVLATPKYWPHLVVRQQIVQTPIFHLWSRDDATCCGSDMLRYTDADGQTLQGEGCALQNEPLATAIAGLSEKNSVSRRVCVDDPAKTASLCDYHGPTKTSAGSVGGDRDRGGEDYNRVIMEWVHDRLNSH